MIDAISSAVASPERQATGESAAPEMGQQDFLKLLVAQLRHQDPLNPVQNTEFVTQLAQFTSLEQTMGINSRLDLLANQTRGLANSEAVNLVGQDVVVSGNRLTHEGTGAPVLFNLDAATAETKVVVLDEFGKEVKTIDLGPQVAGRGQVRWDGTDNTGTRVPPGTYSATISAKSGEGSAVVVSQETTGTVESVSFEQGYAVLKLDNGVSVPVSDLLRVQSSNSSI